MADIGATTPSTELAVTTTLVPAVVFAPGGVDTVLETLRKEVRTLAKDMDVSTQQGRVSIASLAYMVARSKTALDKMGKDLGEEHYTAWKSINAERSKITTACDELRAEVRKPLNDFEAAEAARIKGHQDALDALVESAEFYAAGNTGADLTARLAWLENQPPRDWQEFARRAADTLSGEIARVKVAQAREAAAAEAERLRVEEVARIQRERDERVAAEAAAKAKQEAEAKAADDAKAAAEKAKRDQGAAIKAERKRVADEAAAVAAETARREADKKHRAAVNRAARDEIVRVMAEGIEDPATAVVSAIARGLIPHVTISY
jgi:colicin import membrane protein